ncbi:flagellar biosynthetic protein FliR [Humisphaera borealis]|uniref:Flagellar biosynthetic protein FliR n=1 Tax=Humisphaera borealis TaxID=2807512 RepID=A0A7M2X1S3_9BACT|nr:flagellar biosynthetic protein FliR [Humisphaera borealis]QOV91614.1 flagellar biosynthetic protein FliR [Humisphaera borealis]
MIDDVLQRVPVFVLVVFRLAGMMLMSPLFSSPRTPRRVKAMLVIVLAFGISGGVKAVPLPESMWELTLGIGGEMVFGLAMGMAISFTFIAAQWAGEIIGMEMGLNLSSVFDPSMGAGGSLMGDLYYFVALAVFLLFGGHHALLNGVKASFDHLPLLSLSMNPVLLDTLVGMFETSMILTLKLAAPMLITVLVVDLALGLIGRTMPQFNVMQAGLSIRSIVGLVLVILGLGLTSGVLEDAVIGSVQQVQRMWSGA